MDTAPIWRRPVFILISCIVMVMIAYGTRQSFGLYMRPMSVDMGWGREVLSVALATQNLLMGAGAAFAGALATRWGAAKTIAIGGGLYASGLFFMSQSTTPEALFISSGILSGLGLSACGVPLMAGVVGQIAPERVRTTWVGLITGAATGGQLVMLPFTQYLLGAYDWVFATLVMSVCVAMILPIALGISGASKAATRLTPETQSIRDALREASRHRGYLILLLGFYVCGFQVNFIGSHLPAHIVDAGVAARWGAIALMLVAFFNMIGSWGCGWIGDRYRKKYALSILYTFRTLLIVGFLVLPVTSWTIVIFSAGVGLTWLGTLPLVSGIIVDVFGVRYMAMLFGVVYFSHQLGAFTGIWLGGHIFDTTGSYDAIWLIAILLGVATAIIHLPIDDRPVARLVKA
ncbi:MAG: MFS transporter [Rhodospirillaceae bacterium]|nr:MFS transporter [Rhodospirillaceae bacterium]